MVGSPELARLALHHVDPLFIFEGIGGRLQAPLQLVDDNGVPGVGESLGLHDPLHVGCPVVLGGHDEAEGIYQAVLYHNFLHLFVQNILYHPAAQLFHFLISRRTP